MLDRFSDDERTRVGVHTGPGGDQDSVHSLDIDYAELLPTLFSLHAGNFYLQLASESDRRRVLQIVRDHSRDDQRVFVGVIDPIDPRVETAEEVSDRVLEAAEYIPVERLAPATTAGSRRSPTTRPPRGTRPSRRSRPGSRALGWPLLHLAYDRLTRPGLRK